MCNRKHSVPPRRWHLLLASVRTHTSAATVSNAWNGPACTQSATTWCPMRWCHRPVMTFHRSCSCHSQHMGQCSITPLCGRHIAALRWNPSTSVAAAPCTKAAQRGWGLIHVLSARSAPLLVSISGVCQYAELYVAPRCGAIRWLVHSRGICTARPVRAHHRTGAHFRNGRGVQQDREGEAGVHAGAERTSTLGFGEAASVWRRRNVRSNISVSISRALRGMFPARSSRRCARNRNRTHQRVIAGRRATSSSICPSASS